MSYMRWTDGDAYVIGRPGGFSCVSCYDCKTYREILLHLLTAHDDAWPAIERLMSEAKRIGLGHSWEDALVGPNA